MINTSKLANNIKGSLDNLIDGFLGNSTGLGLYPESGFFQHVQNQINPENWSYLSFPYTFAVVDVDTGKPALGFKDFQLPLAPQAITQSEQFATSIKPTQGGTVVTHSGNRYKTLTLKGTTGIAPFRGAGGVDMKTGQGIFQPADLKFRSGYEVFLLLRNYFKTYYEAKKGGFGFSGEAKNARLVFKNYKDGEFLVVELIDFTMDRQSAKPHLYDYQIECKVLGSFTFSTTEEDDFFSNLDDTLNEVVRKIDFARGVFTRAQDIIRQVEATYDSAVNEPLRKIALAIKAAKGIPMTASDCSKRAIKNTMKELNTIALLTGLKNQKKESRNSPSGASQALSSIDFPNDLKTAVQTQGTDALDTVGPALFEMPVTTLPASTLEAFQDDIVEAQAITKSSIENTIDELSRIRDNCEDAFNLGSDEYDQLFDRTTTLQSDFGKITTDTELDILDAFNQSIQALNVLLVNESMFKSSFESQVQSLVNDFNNQIQLQSLPSVRQYILSSGDTLERIAQREMGDRNRWPEIIEVNDLKYPFITDDITSTKPNVAIPGQTILIPDTIKRGFSDAPKGKEINAIRGMNEVQRSLGVDFKVTSDFDLALGNNDDLQIVAGTDNMAQAVFLKLVYEKGDVLTAPEIGVGLEIGTKIQALNQIHDAVVSSLMQDPRVETIKDLAIKRDGPMVALTFSLIIKKVDIPVPVRIRL